MSDEGYKVVGELDDMSGAGIFGHNTATSGDAIGVEGKTESSEGYGLYTEDDARVGGNLTAGKVNGVRWASSPDDINTQLQKLPEYGGVVRLVPDDYSDGDWSDPIEIPNKNGKLDTLTIDMRGSRIDLNSFNPDTPYIRRTVSEHQPLTLTLYGPDRWDVQGLTEPPSAVRLSDIELSYVHLPYLVGPFEFAVEKVSEFASGHFCRIFVHGWNTRSGFKIGDKNASQTSDRSFYFGQFGNVTDYGAKIEQGKWNTIYSQVENTDGEGFGYDYYIEPRDDLSTGGNRLKINERGADTPFYVLTTRCRFDLVGGMANRSWSKSRHIVPPERVNDVGFDSETFRWRTDKRNQFDIGGSASTVDEPTTIVPYGALRLDAGTADGENTYIQTIANATGSGPWFRRVWGELNPIGQSEAIHRFGIWEDEANHVLAEADLSSSGSGNWELVVTESGSTVREDTEVTASKTGTTMSVGADADEQYLALKKNGSLEHGTADARASFGDSQDPGFGRTEMRAETIVNADDGTDATEHSQFDIRVFAYER